MKSLNRIAHTTRLPNASRMLGSFELLECRQVLAGVPRLVMDVQPTMSEVSASDLQWLGEVSGTHFFFSSNNSEPADEGLWKTDGKDTGAQRLSSVRVTTYPQEVSMARIGNELYFVGTESFGGAELWKTDGTVSGTKMVTDLAPGSQGSNPRWFATDHEILYFEATDTNGDTELWRSDGTGNGTWRVADINPTGSSYPNEMTSVDGTVYFAAKDGFGEALWKTDGTALGTTRVKSFSSPGLDLREFRNVGRQVFFVASGLNPKGPELWVTDGTDAGTRRVLGSGVGGDIDQPQALRAIDGLLYFNARSPAGFGAWRTDGTVAGTQLLVDRAVIEPAIKVGNAIYFSAIEEAGNALWKSDGTPAGTERVKLLAPNVPGSYMVYATGLTDVDGTLYFTTQTPVQGHEIWKSDGTEVGTTRVSNFPGNSSVDFTVPQAAIGGELVFRKSSQLWKTNGTAAGTVPFPLVDRSADSTEFTQLIDVNGTLFFAITDASKRDQLWKTDGTLAGTVLLKTLTTNVSDARPRFLTPVNGRLYFVSDGRVWRSDGSTAGTQALDLGTLNDVPFARNVMELTQVGGTIYFSTVHGTGARLWRSDGTADGTKLVKEFASLPYGLTAFENRIHFLLRQAPSHYGLWKSDGTTDGTVLVRDLTNGDDRLQPVGLTATGNVLQFAMLERFGEFNAKSTFALWRSDGTEAGTVSYAHAGYFDDTISQMTNVGGSLFYRAYLGTSLWREGVLFPVPSAGVPATANGRLYFARTEAEAGRELWETDFLGNGPTLFSDVIPGSVGSSPEQLTIVGDRLYFTASDQAHGRELWVIDLGETNDDLNRDAVVDVLDMEAMRAAKQQGYITRESLEAFWSRHGTGPGDADFDGHFRSSDLVAVFQINKYESTIPATWRDGDWNGDGYFDSEDLVEAFQRGAYEDSLVAAVLDEDDPRLA